MAARPPNRLADEPDRIWSGSSSFRARDRALSCAELDLDSTRTRPALDSKEPDDGVPARRGAALGSRPVPRHHRADLLRVRGCRRSISLAALIVALIGGVISLMAFVRSRKAGSPTGSRWPASSSASASFVVWLLLLCLRPGAGSGPLTATGCSNRRRQWPGLRSTAVTQAAGSVPMVTRPTRSPRPRPATRRWPSSSSATRRVGRLRRSRSKAARRRCRAAAEAADVALYVHAPYVLNVATTNNRIRIPSRKLLQQTVDLAAEVGPPE